MARKRTSSWMERQWLVLSSRRVDDLRRSRFDRANMPSNANSVDVPYTWMLQAASRSAPLDSSATRLVTSRVDVDGWPAAVDTTAGGGAGGALVLVVVADVVVLVDGGVTVVVDVAVVVVVSRASSSSTGSTVVLGVTVVVVV